MSEIRTATISDLAGTGPATLTKQSAAKAWVHYNASSSVTINESFNISSMVDIAAGNYGANLTSSMSSASHAQTLAAGFSALADDNTAFGGYSRRSVPTASSMTVSLKNFADGSVASPSFAAMITHGDLA